MYQNEEEVGRTLHEVISARAVKQEYLFITSKLWNNFHIQDRVRPAIEEKLSLLIHWPVPFKQEDDLFPDEPSNVDYVETWKGMEEVQEAGLTRTIIASNFNHEQIERIMAVVRISPACN